jgi:hypothetical protein
MRFRLPTPALAALAVVAAVLDLALVTPIAVGDSAVEDAAPADLPAEAFLTGPVVEEAQADGLTIQTYRAENGEYAVAIVNPDAGTRHVDLRLEVASVEGPAFSRMMPPSETIARVSVRADLAPGARVVRTFAAEKRSRKLEPGYFHAVRIQVQDEDGEFLAVVTAAEELDESERRPIDVVASLDSVF